MNISRLGLAIAAGLLLGGPASAMIPPGPAEIEPYSARDPELVMLAGGADLSGTERTALPGDVLWSTGIGIAATARVAAPLQVEIGGVTMSATPRSMLYKVAAKGGDLGRSMATAKIYCADSYRRRGTVASALTLGIADLGKRLAGTIRLCLVDAEADGQFESAFLIGTNLEFDRHRVAIAPVAYAERTNEPLAGARMDITYRPGKLLQGDIIALDVYLQGTLQDLEAVQFQTGPRKWQTVPVDRGVAKRVGTNVTFGGLDFDLKSADQATRQIAIRYGRPFYDAPMRLRYTQHVMYIYVGG